MLINGVDFTLMLLKTFLKLKPMKLFRKSHDGGKDSGVTGYFIVELKSFFSIVILRFSKGTRDAYHSHAFNAFTFWLKGSIKEHDPLLPKPEIYKTGQFKYTPRNKMHMVEAMETTWAISIRGPWKESWYELKNGKIIELTHGRNVVSET